MWAYRVTGPLRFQRISVARPTRRDLVDGEVIVRLRVGGICGSDLPEARGLVPIRTPASGLGLLHEIVGDVVRSADDRVQVGQRVVGWVKDQHGLSEYVIAAERQLLAVPAGLVANVPVNAATPSSGRPRRPIPASLSQSSRRGTAPSCSDSSDQIPANKSGVVRVGSIRAVMNREYDATTTSTGSGPAPPAPRGTTAAGNHRSHCAWSPGS